MTHAVLITSLSPTNDTAQRRAVASWQDHGFTVISHNVATEAERLVPDYPDVTFRSSKRTATTKPLPLIGDMIADLCHQPADLFGIINADIVLRPGTEIIRRLQAPLTQSLIAVVRTDVDDLETLENPSLARGFDAFFFDHALTTILDDRAFCIGMPNWDYWLPMAAHAAGWSLSSITAPIALHRRHATRWSDKTLAFNHHLMRFLLSEPIQTAGFAFLDAPLAAAYEDAAFRAFRDSTLDDSERYAALETLATIEDRTMSAMLTTLRAAMPEFQTES
ncbi:MAG: hypothetical protein JXQ84_02140 [Rhodospirillaceae bacterium]|nr:hypothetical protein [Rhodospirillaceae bacterium]